MGQTCSTSHGCSWKCRCMISISMQVPFKMPSSTLPKGMSLASGGRSERVCSSSNPAGGQKQSGESSTKHPPFPVPGEPVRPRSPSEPAGTYPSPTTTHLMACMALDPWRREVRPRQTAGWDGQVWLSGQQVARREEVEEGTSVDDHPRSLRP